MTQWRVRSASCHLRHRGGQLLDDACTFSPASAPDALTVGATRRSTARPPIPIWIVCDLYAPGTLSCRTDHDWTRPPCNLSGTSMADSHVTGAAALYLETHPRPRREVAELSRRRPRPGTGSRRRNRLANLLLFVAIRPARSPPKRRQLLRSEQA